MIKLCYPAIALMNRLRYAQKFILITLLFCAPLILLASLLISEIEDNTTRTRQELAGLQYLHELRYLYEYLPEMQLQEHMFVHSLTLTTDELLQSKAKVEDKINRISALDSQVGANLETTPLLNNFTKTYTNLKERLDNHRYATVPSNSATEPTSDELYSQLSEQLRAMMAQVGDNSYLVLDNELSTYHLIITVLGKLPDTQDAMVQARILGEAITVRKSTTQAERSQLSLQVKLFQTGSDEIKKSLGVVFEHSSLAKANLTAPFGAATTSITAFSDQIQQEITAAPVIKLKPETYIATANQAVAGSFNLWDQLNTTLDSLLNQRLNDLLQKKFMIIGVAVAILVLISYFLLGFYLSVRRTVAGLALASRRMVNGNTSDLLNFNNRDELGEVVTAFNEVATALISTSAELQIRQRECEIISQKMLNLATELKLNAGEQASGSTQQVAVITQVNAAASESFATADRIAELAQQVAGTVNAAASASQQIATTTNHATQQSAQGTAAISQTVQLSSEGEEVYRHLLETMQELTAKTASTRRILDLLSGIASETHLLALNASIEAAGAGDFGNRFQVIAQEVKNLADRAAAASKEVVNIAHEIESGVLTTLDLASDGYQKAQTVAERAEQAGRVIEEMLRISTQSQEQAISISQATQQIRQLTEMIRIATLEQRGSSQQVLEAVDGLGVIARQTATGSQFVSATASSLEEVSHTLNAALVA